ncbi:phosphatase PAP2 family protein [Aquimarina sp. TRL1]|nr:phosphatase PAP2 family protein [Aquimarina sp. TRL1]QKX03400.1 phosphatase PAP2 family protein [Aquimarina sp. TRL1]
MFVLAFCFQLMFVLLFKQLLFHNLHRPFLLLKETDSIHLVKLIEGVKIRYVNSFPSGHTTCIFFIVSFLSVLIKKRMISWGLFVIGLLVGISRIYLVQHFFVDVYFGICFGTVSSLLAYWVVKVYPKIWFEDKLRIRISLERKRAWD